MVFYVIAVRFGWKNRWRWKIKPCEFFFVVLQPIRDNATRDNRFNEGFMNTIEKSWTKVEHNLFEKVNGIQTQHASTYDAKPKKGGPERFATCLPF